MHEETIQTDEYDNAEEREQIREDPNDRVEEQIEEEEPVSEKEEDVQMEDEAEEQEEPTKEDKEPVNNHESESRVHKQKQQSSSKDCKKKSPPETANANTYKDPSAKTPKKGGGCDDDDDDDDDDDTDADDVWNYKPLQKRKRTLKEIQERNANITLHLSHFNATLTDMGITQQNQRAKGLVLQYCYC